MKNEQDIFYTDKSYKLPDSQLFYSSSGIFIQNYCQEFGIQLDFTLREIKWREKIER